MQNIIHQVMQIYQSTFGVDILNLLFLHDISTFFHVEYMSRLDKATYLSFLLKFILSQRLINSL